MMRTQIYLTEGEITALDLLANQSGKKRSELIREAIDNLISKYNQNKRRKILDRAAGMWASRDDLPNFAEMRKSLDRSGF